MSTGRIARMSSQLGLTLTAGLVAVQVVALAILRPTAVGAEHLAVIAAAGAALLLACRRIRPRGLPSLGRLVSVLVVFGCLAATGPLTSPATSLIFSSGYVVVFIYIGMTFRPGSAAALTPVATACWLLTNVPVTTAVWSRLPIIVGIWILIGELLAARVQQAAHVRALLRREADHDPLTGLYNRNGFDARLAPLRPGDAVVFVDLDHFKAVNDTFGHQAGDRVLTDLGRVVLSVLRERDIAVRYGGEEVLLMLRGAGRAGAERVLHRLKSGWDASHRELTFSAGVAVVGADGDGASAVRHADGAVYEAKRGGRDRWVHAPDRRSVTGGDAVIPAQPGVLAGPR